eukprot:TRINITY_DN20395_c0_g2_i1.p1 TRINITY_DN20395_c0_g2~~TRINITY_DN20395_c0_g2_i1.p1  ORF type:complete len:376 (+),score=35.24 TRINITY_DN20395_c0_g2_i1:96-1130(+)
MGKQRYDWSVGSRAQDFDIVVEQLGGLFDKKTTPTPIMELMKQIGYQVEYDHVRSHLQAERKKFRKSQEVKTQSQMQSLSSKLCLDSGSYEDHDYTDNSPFVSSSHIPNFNPQPQFEVPEFEANIFNSSGATDVKLENVSDLLSSKFSKMSIDQGSQEMVESGSSDVKMEQLCNSRVESGVVRIGSELPSVDVNQFFKEPIVEPIPEQGEQPSSFKWMKQEPLKSLFQKFATDSPLSDVTSDWVELGNSCKWFQAPDRQQYQDVAFFNGFVQQNCPCQVQQELVLYPDCCQQLNGRNVFEAAVEGCVFDPHCRNHIHSVSRDSLLQDQRAIITGDPSYVQRWQN